MARLLVKYDPSETPRVEIMGGGDDNYYFGSAIEDGAGRPRIDEYRIINISGVTAAELDFLKETIVERYRRIQDNRLMTRTPDNVKKGRRMYWVFDYDSVPAAAKERFKNPANRAQRVFNVTRAQFRSIIQENPFVQQLKNAGRDIRNRVRGDKIPEA